MSESRLVFAGTPEFAAVALTALLHSAGWRVVAVFTQPDRPAGRGRQPAASPVKQLAAAHGIPVMQPAHFKSPEALADLAALQPDLMIVAAYGLLLPQSVLDVPCLGCVNIHASLLPRWRGAAPIQRAILAGDAQSGISLMRMEAGLDTGPVFATATCPITAEDNAQTLHDRLALLGADTLVAKLPAILRDAIEPIPQAHEHASYATKIQRGEATLDFTASAEELARRVRGYYPKPVATAILDGQEVRILDAEAVPAEATGTPPGTLMATTRDLLVGTGAGLLRIKRLQLPGKRPITGIDYRNAQRTSRH